MLKTASVISMIVCFLLGSLFATAPAKGPSPAVNIVFERLSIEQGLSQSIIEGIIQDQTGFMWFATEDGLNRYDGYSFRVFKHDPQDQSSLAHSEIKAICPDHLGTIWVGTFHQGLEKFDPETERFTHFRSDPKNPESLSSAIVRAIYEDHSGVLWVGTIGGGLNRLQRGNDTFIHYRNEAQNPSSLSHDDVGAITDDRSGRLWVGTRGGGLNQLDPATSKFTRYIHRPDDPHSLSHNDVRAICVDRSGIIWIGTFGGGLDHLDPATGVFTHFRHNPQEPNSLGHDAVLAVFEDSTGTLWVGTDGGGLNRFDRESGTFTRYLKDPNNLSSLSGNRIYAIQEDRAGVLWVGTYGEGLSKTDLRKKPFALYRNDPNDPNSLSHNIVWTFCEDQAGLLWVGTNDGGLDRFDHHRRTFTHFRHDPTNPNSLCHNSVRKVITDRQGFLWLATNGGGLDKFDPKAAKFIHYRHDPTSPGSLANNELRTVYEDHSGTIWAGTYGAGLDRFNPSTQSFAHYRHDPQNPRSISNNYIRAVYEDRSGLLWIGTHGGGLNAFDPKTGTFQRYQNDPSNPHSLSNDFIFSILQDRAGTLWVATYGGGLNKFDPRTRQFSCIRKSNGLPDDNIYGILEDQDGNLWLSTLAGLCKYNCRTNQCRNYTIQDGLQSNEFNGGAYYQSASGLMYFGGINGFNVFHPAAIQDNPFLPPLVITDFRLVNKVVPIGAPFDDRVILTRSITYTRSIDLSHNDQAVFFEFAALHFANPNKNQYAYRLEGWNDEWIELGSRRFIMFTALPSGDYVLRIKGANSDGVWNQTGISLRISVPPPWWRTRWAYTLYILAGIGLFFSVLTLVKRREREKARIRETELRAQAAELQAKYLESQALVIRVENERKTRELEDARQLQLSMLPESLPQHPKYEIAECMFPATEVGGDYFDFHLAEDGALTVAIGDATGHGMRAGIMVAVMKVLFSTWGDDPDIPHFFHHSNDIIQKIGLENMLMAMMVLHFQENRFRAVAAAMPPILVLRSKTGRVEEITLTGMFLGAGVELPFDEVTVPLEPGDVVLLMSDGLAELRNERDEFFDYPRIQTCFEEAAVQPPQEVVNRLIIAADAWRGTIPQNDDITLIVIKYNG